jgi:preprotein translocase subunit SecE
VGRLQRKKTATTSKKKKQNKSSELITQADNKQVVEKKMSLFSSSGTRSVTSQKKASALKVREKNVIDKSIQFLREVKTELKKVTWPSRKQTMGSTVVVIVLVLIISIFLGVVDIGLSKLVQTILQ